MRRSSPTQVRTYDAVFYVPWIGGLLAPGSGPPPGGAETQLYVLALELARQGRRVCVVSYEAPNLPDQIEGIDVVTRPPPRWRQIRGMRGKLAEVAAIWHAVGRLDGDAFVQRGTSMETGFVALAAKLRRRRFVYSSANIIDFDWGSVASRRNVALFHLGVRLADEIVVQTAEQQDLCRARFGRNCTLIPSLVEPAPQRRAEPQAFLWIGKLAFYKRPLAFVELARAVPEARFWMVGVASEKDSGNIAARLRSAAAEIPNLELLDPRPRPELMGLVERAVAIVSTSEYEGMANVMLEGWARGVPAVTLEHDPDGLIEAEGLGACAGGSAERLAELVRKLWEARHRGDALSARCRSYVEREHSPQVVAERWARALRLSSNGGRGPG